MAPHEKTDRRSMNAFQLARPRGTNAPAKLPVQRKKKAVPITYSNKRVLNAAGKWQAYLEPARHSIVIETAEQARAGNDKRQKIVRGLS